MKRVEYAFFAIASVAIIGALIIIVVNEANFGISQVLLMLALVLITFIYAMRTSDIAKATRQQADASVRMAEEMKHARLPAIMIDWIGPWPDSGEGTSAVFRNTGFGLALNLECYLTHPKFNFDYKDVGYTVMGVGEKHTISLRHENFNRERPGLAINCDYRSVYGESFRSILRWETEEKRHFEILERKGENK